MVSARLIFVPLLARPSGISSATTGYVPWRPFIYRNGGGRPVQSSRPWLNMQQTLRITEIFYSLQGETRTAGLPTVFVRLTGCPLRCHYCDTAYAFSGGDVVSLDAIFERVAAYKPRYICVTGGEPLAQPNCISLLERLCDAGYEVSLETSGALDVSRVDPRVSKVLDLKTPGSGEVGRNRYENIPLLTDNDQVKFVVCSREDYDWAVSKLIEYRLDQRAGEVLFSPSHYQVSARELADWIVADNLPVRLQLQLHKILWNDEPGH
ncbi:7-carboxy-7-deazaguanine synthase QueE [Pseudomonas aeruginosa]|nr:7-carboxy-7-deazaguanine synthase QueE [Pseudomonas aeruginosa]NPT09061.1 7-carboxy-7-deazaguanine synthase QueE [Pseudomonas aeruginosa]NPZ83541.1 7-carboxy-7-deazaguanine synthase QueE [Pseudomonas aeruginosa]PBY65826.1 7-carboxy-7-deazaguanine synthase QueE [Pseudomonas aeruginosa]RPX75203.1 7-carboxy-7-deazaguanine synthase QueE [Pseudomonas aeruginosa]